MGAIGGGIWHGIKGARNSPRVRCLLRKHGLEPLADDLGCFPLLLLCDMPSLRPFTALLLLSLYSTPVCLRFFYRASAWSVHYQLSKLARRF